MIVRTRRESKENTKNEKYLSVAHNSVCVRACANGNIQEPRKPRRLMRKEINVTLPKEREKLISLNRNVLSYLLMKNTTTLLLSLVSINSRMTDLLLFCLNAQVSSCQSLLGALYIKSPSCIFRFDDFYYH